MIVLLVGAFFYIDFNSHKGFLYEVISDEESIGTMRLEKYITENRLVYKAKIKKTNTFKYALMNEELYIDRNSKDIVRLDKEMTGVYGEKIQVAFLNENNNNDYVYLDYPKFINIAGGYINKAKTIMIPGDPVLYLAMMEKYNFWRKGKQFYDAVISPAGAIAPFIETVEVNYVEDDYVQVMGKKIQAEIYIIKSSSLFEVKVALSKFYHELLFVENTICKERVELISIGESLFERIVERIISFAERLKIDEQLSAEDIVDKNKGMDSIARNMGFVPKTIKKEEIFINDGTTVLSGIVLCSKEKNNIQPKIFIVSDDGSITVGEKMMLDALSLHLVKKGFMVIALNSLMEANKETSLYCLDDETKEKAIGLFLEHFSGFGEERNGPVIFVGYKGGGFISLSSCNKTFKIAGCVQLHVPGLIRGHLDASSAGDYIKKVFADSYIKTNKNKHIEFVRKHTLSYVENILKTEQDVLSFRRFNLPLKEYREYLNRDYSSAIQSFNAPLLFLYSKKQKEYFGPIIADIKREIMDKSNFSRAFEIQNSSGYFGELVSNDGTIVYNLQGDFLGHIDKWLNDIVERYEQK